MSFAADLRQMMHDWDNATDAQRTEALRISGEQAAAAEAALLAARRKAYTDEARGLDAMAAQWMWYARGHKANGSHADLARFYVGYARQNAREARRLRNLAAAL